MKVVSQISVEQENLTGNRVYTDPHKMQRILTGLRQLGQRFRPDNDPEQLSAPLVTITLTFSDGSLQHYHMKSDRYIQTGQQGWQQTDSERLRRLQFLIKALPGDADKLEWTAASIANSNLSFSCKTGSGVV